jgi:hypothetical protein
VLNIVSFLLNLINQHFIWLYAACLLIILFYARSYSLAHKERENTIFTIEKEVAAHKEGQAMSGIGIMLGIAVVITVLRFYLVPSLDLTAIAGPTPTFTLPLPTRMVILPTATPTLTPAVPTATLRPSPTPPQTQTAFPVTITPVAPPAPACGDANVRITAPGVNLVAAGRVVIQGTANHARFQFYKVEYALGEQPGPWNVIHDIHRAPVVNGWLEELDVSNLPNGPCWIQLTVVDQSGNFPSPCRVRILIQH